MNVCLYLTRATLSALALTCGIILPGLGSATSLPASPISQASAGKESPEDKIVERYVAACRSQPPPQTG